MRAEGVFYATGQYAGIARRLMIIVVDLAVLTVLSLLLLEAFAFPDPGREGEIPRVLSWAWLGMVYLYLVVLKRSPIGTPGYRALGVKVVDQGGQVPSLARMTFRFLLWVFGPINPLLDLFWVGGDSDRQTIRDKLAGTYVVRRHASPDGTGRVELVRYTLMGLTFMFPEVRRGEVDGQGEEGA
jgi:uncharacterized RDD family membrane protein YckC